MVEQLAAGGLVVNELAKVWLTNWRQSRHATVHRAVLRNVINRLPTPSIANLPSGQPVALIDGDEFERTTSAASAEANYDSRRRTILFEGVDWLDNSWFQLAARQLAAVAGYGVTVSVYVSRSGDAGLLPHTDAWTGLILQLRGSKVWFLGDQEDVLETHPGDILYLPTGVKHRVGTPATSTHAVFEVLTESGRSL